MPAASSAPLIACESVERTYRRSTGRFRRSGPEVRALDGVSLTVERGEILGIVGPSGSGKSTLLHLLGALDVPSAGQVRILGQDTTALSARGRRRLRQESVGIVFQRFHLLPALSARSNVAVALIEAGHSKAERRSRADEVLDTVGLSDRADHAPGELSGGERQRVAIARALAPDPDVVIADEPTGELDTATGERVLDALAAVAEDRAVVLASHDDQAVDRADRVLELRDGRVIGDPED
ncbi:MAG: ABC transporter ATP-binding protein [Halococcoides sp.]